MPRIISLRRAGAVRPLTFRAFATGGVVYAAVRPKTTGDGWRVRTHARRQSAALFAAFCLSSGVTLIAKCETAEGKSRIVPICRGGKLARGARALLWTLLSHDEYELLLMFGISRRHIHGGTTT